ncbi:uncharacterized protein LOC120014213 isoform X1 [Tripterygium wilfordii]|nr:uncharacterized protein LOC120014213 isoform X1 [Tripterygium wilfordii]
MEAVKRSTEKGKRSGGDKNAGPSIDDVVRLMFYDHFFGDGLSFDLTEPGHVVGSFKVPDRMLNAENFLRGWAMATLTGLVGSAVLSTVGAPKTGDSFETYIPPYLDTVYVDDEVEVEAKVLSVGKIIGVVSVELRNKKTGKTIVHTRHAEYFQDGNSRCRM